MINIIDITMIAQKTYFTNITSQITMLWNRPCCSYQPEIFREYFPNQGVSQIRFRKSQKISGF